LSNLAGAAIASEAIRDVVAAASHRERAPDPSVVIRRDASPPANAGVAIQARDLLFRYPRQPEPALDGCSLLVARGSRLLLEGASGAGKSTLASLLSGLRMPDSGLLLVDGLDRSVLGKAGWRRRVVMAPQAHDNFLIGGSLAFNLLMGRRWPAQPGDLAAAEAICRELGLGDLLDRLPGGLHQFVGETGWQLSQGERTRVFLARALLQDPDVLILDESFSALDPENVDRASRCVQRLARTIIAVAHT
jgi:ATP-binding cassette subfamily B protein